MSADNVSLATLAVGDELSDVAYPTSVTQIFRYSAATWNTHRIHFDQSYARAEGYPDVLVQSHLHGAFLANFCTRLAGDTGRLRSLSLSVRRFAVAGETLIVRGVVTSREERERGVVVGIELHERRESDGQECVNGTASIEWSS